MKKIISLALILAIGLWLCAPVAADPLSMLPEAPEVSAVSAILINPANGAVYYEKNADAPMGPASTTKLMTALVVAESVSPDTEITVPAEAVGVEGSSIYLVEGEILTAGELLRALLLSSANDAATALAIALDGSIEKFCDRMNRRAASMGLTVTHFENPHGLYHEAHVTTARELALIGAEVLENPLLREIVSTKKATIPHDGVPDKRLLVNHNKLLGRYEGAMGMKTGFTKKTGRTLVSAAERDGMTLIAVTLDAPDDWRDHTALLDYGFASYERVCFAAVGEFSFPLPVTGGKKETVRLTNEKALILYLPKLRSADRTRVESPCRFAFAPVAAGDTLGTVTVECEGHSVTSPLTASEAVFPSSPVKKNLWERLITFFHT